MTLQGLGALWQQLWRHDRRGDDLCKNPRFGANWAILKVYGLKVRDLGLRFMNRVWVLGSCRPQEMGVQAWDSGLGIGVPKPCTSRISERQPKDPVSWRISECSRHASNEDEELGAR